MKRIDQIPTATYRLQFTPQFTFRDASRIVPYLSALGISHIYASPYLRARPGSLHGYDIIDHNSLNPELGSPEDYEALVSALHRHGMRQILDIVPNHMGVMGSDNAWWLDVLENGEASDYADFFDIDWDPIKDELQGKVLIPVLAEQYGDALEEGDLTLTFDAERGEFSIFYYQHRFPIDPKEYPLILGFRIELFWEKLGPTHEDVLELQSIITAFGHLPDRRGATIEQKVERNREKEVQKRRLATLCARSPQVREFFAQNLVTINGDPEDPRSFDTLHELIKAQPYRFAQWRVAADDINYRRFFDINDLAALRNENDRVFDETHKLILQLVAEGKLDGVRVDHPDGLYDPAGYFAKLRDRLCSGLKPKNRDAYLVAEKILTGKEHLPENWPIDGTTGYEFGKLVNGLFVDKSSAQIMERIYRSFAGITSEFADIVYQCKKQILKVVLASELNVLANLLSRIALASRYTCDFTLNALRSALREVIASFPVYRTYVNGSEVSEEDRRYVQQAVVAGKKKSNAADLSVFDFIQRILLVDVYGSEAGWYRQAVLRFSMKFQQVTAAVMAKGLEDTAFYRYNRLISLNEVGGDPAQFGTTVEAFHGANQERLCCWPDSMLGSSTHDSKRSEDVRARIDVLSEMPLVWLLHLRRWRDWNRGKKRLLDDQPVPTRNDEYLLYQTLVGTWPTQMLDDADWKTYTERIEQYMRKAVREAKEHTSWANTNSQYESALTDFTWAILARSSQNLFIAGFEAFTRRIARIGLFNSLSQTLLKLTSPGVPDIYQGNELLEFSLVDPDNRRPVDYERRDKIFETLPRDGDHAHNLSSRVRELLFICAGDRAKMYLTWKTLTFRRQSHSLFQRGSYVPLKAQGEMANHVVAFARRHEGRTIVIATPRLCAKLMGENYETISEEAIWRDSTLELPSDEVRCYHNLFTGECLPLKADSSSGVRLFELFRTFPVALLVSEWQVSDEICSPRPKT
ncbi:MAG TPA: malto-oligosyltrehalose synthase [Candidatus Sulfotelmatobacter sp.]|nr:malto-oligosyltrehalose synthase [Candidatus Sulfotelmatobacter sp.]